MGPDGHQHRVNLGRFAHLTYFLAKTCFRFLDLNNLNNPEMTTMFYVMWYGHYIYLPRFKSFNSFSFYCNSIGTTRSYGKNSSFVALKTTPTLLLKLFVMGVRRGCSGKCSLGRCWLPWASEGIRPKKMKLERKVSVLQLVKNTN